MVRGSNPFASIMKRSKWKAYKLNYKNSYDRSTIITPEMINEEIKVHNGNSYKLIKITSLHVGHRLGEFYHTKITPRFKGGKN